MQAIRPYYPTPQFAFSDVRTSFHTLLALKSPSVLPRTDQPYPLEFDNVLYFGTGLSRALPPLEITLLSIGGTGNSFLAVFQLPPSIATGIDADTASQE